MNLVRKMTTTPSNDAINFKAAKIVLEYLLDICEWYVQRIEYGEKLAASAFYNIGEMVDVPTNNTVMDLDFAADGINLLPRKVMQMHSTHLAYYTNLVKD